MNHIVVHSGEQNWLRETFLAVGDELAKLFTVSLKSYNLSRNEKISSSDHPLRETCDNFIRVMGIDKKVDIYVASRSPVLIRLLNTSPPAI